MEITIMPFEFFRKERPEVFSARFNVPTAVNNWYGLKTNLIFRAKKVVGEKAFSVRVGRQVRQLSASVSGNALVVKSRPNDSRPHVNLRLSEANMHDTLHSLPRASRADSILYQVAKKLCQDHATSSRSSPFISGCIVDNFNQSRKYDGYKLHLTLKFRQPFENPFVSGLEKEYFLIGSVNNSDCQMIHLYGRTNENINEVVNPPGSKIPRPR